MSVVLEGDQLRRQGGQHAHEHGRDDEAAGPRREEGNISHQVVQAPPLHAGPGVTR